jgi:hypothetical protein
VRLTPISRDNAKAFVREHHRHNDAPVGWKFGASLADDDGVTLGVVIVGRPVNRVLDDGLSLEATRVCTTGAKNANSMLYGAAIRAAEALGYDRLYTYTLQSESGASLKAVGFVIDAIIPARETWDTPARRRNQETRPTEPKYRWIKRLRPRSAKTPVDLEEAA